MTTYTTRNKRPLSPLAIYLIKMAVAFAVFFLLGLVALYN